MLTLVPIFGIIAIGAWAEYSRVLQPNTAGIINRFVYYFALPTLLFHVMSQIKPHEISWQPIAGFLIGTLLCQIIATFAVRLNGKCHIESTMAGLVACFPNVAFMGIPVILLLFPNNLDAEIYAGIGALLPTLSIIYADTSLSVQERQGQSFDNTIRYIFQVITHNPQLIGASLGFMVSISGFELPTPMRATTDMLGGTAAPCALFCIGMTLAAQIGQWTQNVSPGKKQAKNWGLQTIVIGIRLFLSPLLVYVFSSLLGASGIAVTVMTILASLPTAATCFVIAERHEVFTKECIVTIVIGTILSCLTLPLIVSLL